MTDTESTSHQERSIGNLRTAQSNFLHAERQLEKHIRQARIAGLSLRQIAAIAGMSHEQVRRICA